MELTRRNSSNSCLEYREENPLPEWLALRISINMEEVKDSS